MILWSVFRSEIWRKQIYYLSITATQPEIRDHIFQNEMLIPWPANENDRMKIVESANQVLEAQNLELEASKENQIIVNALLE